MPVPADGKGEATEFDRLMLDEFEAALRARIADPGAHTGRRKLAHSSYEPVSAWSARAVAEWLLPELRRLQRANLVLHERVHTEHALWHDAVDGQLALAVDEVTGELQRINELLAAHGFENRPGARGVADALNMLDSTLKVRKGSTEESPGV